MFSKKHWWKLQDVSFVQGSRQTSILRRFLRQRNFKFKRGLSPAQFVHMHSRAERGLMSYYALPVAELRKFCADRKLLNHSGKKKEELIEMLEAADEQCQFPKFLELPPELRILVYEFSFDMIYDHNHEDYRQTHHALTIEPPPVASVCKLLRRESLSLFYSSARHRIILREVASARGPQTFYADREAIRVFNNAPMSLLQGITKLKFALLPSHGIYTDAYEYDIELSTAKGSYQIAEVDYVGSIPYSWGDSDRKDVEQRLRAVLDKMVREGHGDRVKLQRHHLPFFLKAFEGFERVPDIS